MFPFPLAWLPGSWLPAGCGQVVGEGGWGGPCRACRLFGKWWGGADAAISPECAAGDVVQGLRLPRDDLTTVVAGNPFVFHGRESDGDDLLACAAHVKRRRLSARARRRRTGGLRSDVACFPFFVGAHCGGASMRARKVPAAALGGATRVTFPQPDVSARSCLALCVASSRLERAWRQELTGWSDSLVPATYCTLPRSLRLSTWSSCSLS